MAKLSKVFLAMAIAVFCGNYASSTTKTSLWTSTRWTKFDPPMKTVGAVPTHAACAKICTETPDCVAISVEMATRICILSDFDAKQIKDDDFIGYRLWEDAVMTHKKRAVVTKIPANDPTLTHNSRQNVQEGKIYGWVRNMCPNTAPYAFASGSKCCSTSRTDENERLYRNSAIGCTDVLPKTCINCFTSGQHW